MPGFEPEDVTVISVCYKSDAVIGAMIASIPEKTPIILVDNGGTNSFTAVLSDRSITIVNLSQNQGFGRGCNAGAEKAQTPWLLFLNPDARLGDGALEALLRAAQNYPMASAFNPRISNADGSAYFKRRSYLLPPREHMNRGWPEKDCTVPVLSGAALFVSREKFEAVHGFDANIFLYHEDDDLSLRLRELGPLMFVSDAHATHASGNSSERSRQTSYLKAYHLAQSRVYTGYKYHRPAPLLSAGLQAVGLMLSPSAIISGRRRAKAMGFVKGLKDLIWPPHVSSS